MKRVILILIVVALCSCEKEKKLEPPPELELQEGYIIGFDPCGGFGWVISTNSNKDTLIAYLGYSDRDSNYFINRLDTIYKFPGLFEVYHSDTVYKFPDYYYQNNFLFPDSVRSKHIIYLNYTDVPEDQKLGFATIPECYSGLFDKHVRNRQIKVNYATKHPMSSVKLK